MELKVPHSRLFEEFLDTAQTCSQYTYENGVPVGCHFEFTNETEELQFVVADVINKNIEPFYSWMKPFSKLQFPPPIIKISRNDKGEVYVSWNVSGQPSRKLPYQYQLYILNLNNEKALPTEPFTQENERSSKQIENIDPDAKYTVKLRTRYDTEYPWSEWSEEKNILGKPNYWTRNIILATVIPISVTIFTVIAVIYMKRFFLCIFPPIPHPGKIFEKSFSNQNNFQQFTQYNIVTENEEDVCSVILAESPLSSSSSSTCSSAVE
ncbi:interleukin-13 receptor subunit alpha-1 [Pelobates cultripes]|uniref:Interleukin-13 receptor subunit alpha-1 n=2 Tax=Pelobates cultripes TaxID=61616 RepID=A0AAD1WIT9_PELCU|nr:interleukin-13 receptor subunit alpha-1 [Pelobates cultripes]